MKIQKIIYLFFLICFLPVLSKAQITASDTEGCAPLVNVVFGSPAGATNINWDFDDGAGSNLASPTHTFITPGLYNVVFTAIIGGSNVNYTLLITVYGNPTAAFTATPPLSGCIPLTVAFTDASTGGGGSPIVSREWSFGDGGVITGNNTAPSYIYTVAGSFTVSLKVTDTHGCDTSIAKVNHINTSIPPNAVITTNPSPAASCLPPLLVSFSAANSTSNSTSGPALTYLWNFGGGNTATVVAPPAINYPNSGVFPVSLTVTDNNNCPATVSTNVVISAPVASFNAVDAVNDTVCPTVTFHNTSTGVYPYFSYGDGSFGTDTVHTYAPGTYQVTLQVQAGTCFDDSTITIIVENVVSLFTSTPSYSCSWPFPVQYTSISTNASTYSWIFGDSLTSVVKNPLHTYLEEDTNQYTIYYDPLVYVTSLEVTSVHGCKAFSSATDTVWKPTARFMPNKSHGCAPLIVAFSDSSISNEPIVSRLWKFGDGGTAAGNNTNVSHTYVSPGIYYAWLIITNSAGCIDTSYLVPIYVGEPSTPAFSVSPTTVCVGAPVQFTDLTPPGDSAQYWHYNTDGGIMSHCYTDPDPVWSFNTVTGVQSITLTTVYNGCIGYTTMSGAINVKGPLAKFYPSGNCATPFTYVMHGDIQDANYWTWDFGDGNIINNSTNATPSHTYVATGDYAVVLTAYNTTSGCAPYSDTQIINVRNINASFSSDSVFCAGDSITFPANASQDVYTHCYTGYLYYWGDNTPPYNADHPVGHVFQNGGNYTVSLVVKDINGCTDTAKRVVNVYDVQAGFDPDKLYGCMPLTVNFADTTLSDTTIVQWEWTFGDGGTSNLQNPVHTFTQSGVNYWIVSLTVTDALGCTDTRQVIIRPSIPDSSYFVLTPPNICVGDSVSFSANSTIVTYYWTFGNGTNSTLQNPVGHFPNAGNFNVTLTVTDSIGCTSSEVTLVNVQNYPLAGFVSTADTLFNKCYPLLVNFTDTSIVNIFGTRDWDLGNGSATVGNQTVVTIYSAPGTYVITLI
jgi:PKD repeat protein